MPFISDKQLESLQSFVGRQKARTAKAIAKTKERTDEFVSAAECVGAAGAMGYIRGMREDAEGVWNLPFIKADVEMVTGLAMMGTSFFNLWGKYDKHILSMGTGIMAHYTGQIMRKLAKTGSFSQVAGDWGSPNVGALPEGIRTPMGQDPVAAALRRSGIA